MKIEYLLMKKQDDFCQNIEQFKNLISSNVRIVFENDSLLIDKKKLQYIITVDNVEASKEIMFYFQISSLTAPSEVEQVQLLETADELIRRINDNYQGFHINVIWDDVSIYYGKKLYSEIVFAENCLRKIIYFFMLKTVGSEWLQKNTPKEVRESIDKTMEKNNLRQRDTDYLYYADFITLSAFFFSKYPLNSNYQQLIEKLKLAENREEDKLNKLLETYEAKSNWERYFSTQIYVEDLADKWNCLYGFRNQVAHSKRMVKKDYQEAKKLLNELIPAFEECLKHVDRVELTEEQAEAVEEVARETIGISEKQGDAQVIRPFVFAGDRYVWNNNSNLEGWKQVMNAASTSFVKPAALTSALAAMQGTAYSNSSAGMLNTAAQRIRDMKATQNATISRYYDGDSK